MAKSRRTTKTPNKKVAGKKVTDNKTNKAPDTHVNEVVGVLLIALGLILAVAAYFGQDALILVWLRQFMFGMFGIAGYILPVVAVLGGVSVIIWRKKKKSPGKIILGIVGVWSMLAIVQLCYEFDYSVGYFEYLSDSYTRCSSVIMGGGLFAGIIAYPGCVLLGDVGAIIIFAAILIIAIMVIFRLSLKDTGQKVGASIKKHKELRDERLHALLEDDEDDFAFYEEPEPVLPVEEAIPEVQPQPKKFKPEKLEKKKKRKAKGNLYMGDISGWPDADVSTVKEAEELTIIGQDISGHLPTGNARHGAASLMLNIDGRKEPAAKQAEPVKATEPAIIKEDSVQPKPVQRRKLKEVTEDTASHAGDPKSSGYELPPIDLLDESRQSGVPRAGKDEVRLYSELLENTLKSFSVSAKVVNATRGPKVTRYELQPGPGVKISKIVNLSDDIALNLAAESVRIVAPIPGKNAIGIELPNKESTPVGMRDLLDTPEFKNQKSDIAFALGKDITGKNIYADLAKMPHILVAGTTGSGKSVCLNGIITSILYKSTPDKVQFIMIDPKMVELINYNDIPNLKIPVVTDKQKAAGALVWAVTEMVNRYKAFSQNGVRDIDRYNELKKEAGEEIMPKLVVIIDEFADLMMVSAKEVEDAVCRIAQLGRASGIHLVIATQSPRADIFTGLIKANVPSRIALTVANGLESRIIMDAPGAESLLGNGDMLYMPVGTSKPTRIQGCWISPAETERITDFLKKTGSANYDKELEGEIARLAEERGKAAAGGKQEAEAATDGDELVPKAIELALEYEQLSASMLQRRLRVGYNRAARLVDELEAKGIVGPADGSKPRQILIGWEEYHRMYGERQLGDESEIIDD